MLHSQSARFLWYAIEREITSIRELLRLAYESELLSGPDHIVLGTMLREMQNVLRQNEEGRNAIPDQRAI